MKHPLSGLGYLIAGFGLISKPGLRRFVIIPFMINLLLFVGLFFIIRHYVGEFNMWFAHYLPSWLHWFGYIIWLLFLISFFLVFIYLFVTIANLIAAPFNSLLAEKVEFFLTGHLPPERSLFENIKDTPRIVGRQLTLLGYYLPRALFFLILFFIPVVQIIAPIAWFLFNAWYMVLTYIDYPTDNHHIPLHDVHRWLAKRRGMSLGFGISVLITAMIPLLNFFTVPAAVAAATQFWVDENTIVPKMKR